MANPLVSFDDEGVLRRSKRKPGPHFQHDCDECKFLGTHAIMKEGMALPVDAWLDHADGESIILRYSSEGPDYVHFNPRLIKFIQSEDWCSLEPSYQIVFNLAKK